MVVVTGATRPQPKFATTGRSGPIKYRLPFPKKEYKDRLQRLREAMQKANIDVAVTTTPKDFFWLAGTKVSFGYSDNPSWIIVPLNGELTGVVRYLEYSTFRRSSLLENWITYKDGGLEAFHDPMPAVIDTLRKQGIDKKIVGINFRTLNYLSYQRLNKSLPKTKLVDFRPENIRIMKSKIELKCMEKAANANQYALMRALDEIDLGWSEWDVMRLINELHERYLGDDYGGSSENAQTCQISRHVMDMHPQRSMADMMDTRVKQGDLMLIEPGAFVNRLVGCKMRSAFFGKPPESVRMAIDASKEGLQKAIELMGPGKISGDIDKEVRSPMIKKGLDVQSRTGYACGYGWDEGDVASIAPNDPHLLRPGETYHMVVYSYLPYWGHVGMSEQILITENGCRVLANEDEQCPRDLLEVHK